MVLRFCHRIVSACVVAAAVVLFPLHNIVSTIRNYSHYYYTALYDTHTHLHLYSYVNIQISFFDSTHTHTSTDIGTICNIWLGSSAMRCLLGLTVSCFEKHHPHEEEEFVNCLLSTYMQNAPHFDWVVARLGSCFPQKIISK